MQKLMRDIKGGFCHRFEKQKQDINWSVLNQHTSFSCTRQIPIELRYALAIHPSRKQVLTDLLNQGHGLVIGKRKQIPRRVIDAVGIIANTHHGATYPWLMDLIDKRSLPRWSEADFEEAASMNVDLKGAARSIIDHCDSCLQVRIIQSPKQAISPQAHEFAKALEKDMRQISALEISYQMLSEHLSRGHDWIYLALISLAFIAPLVHVLEILMPGLGKVGALLIPIMFYEIFIHTRSYIMGMASWQIVSKIKSKWPEYITLFAAAVFLNLFLAWNLNFLAALAFFAASVVFIAGRELRRLRKSKQVYQVLLEQGKIQTASRFAWLKLYYGPLWWAFGLDLVLTLAVFASVFALTPSVLSNGWILVALALTPHFFFYAILRLWRLILSIGFERRVNAMLKTAIIA